MWMERQFYILIFQRVHKFIDVKEKFLTEMKMVKQSSYTENRIFPYAELNELEEELFTRVRKTVANMRPDHPWTLMDNVDILKSAGMFLKDQSTGKQGITLAGILIFGSELMIQTALPHYKTDAIQKTYPLIQRIQRLRNFLRK